MIFGGLWNRTLHTRKGIFRNCNYGVLETIEAFTCFCFIIVCHFTDVFAVRWGYRIELSLPTILTQKCRCIQTVQFRLPGDENVQTAGLYRIKKTCINTKSSGSDYSLLILMLRRVRIPANLRSYRNYMNLFFSLCNIAVHNYFTHIHPHVFWIRHDLVALLPRKEPRTLLNRRLVGPQSRSGRFGGEKNLLGIRNPDRAARSLGHYTYLAITAISLCKR